MEDKKFQPYKATLNAGNAYWMAKISKEIYTQISDENNAPDEGKILGNLIKSGDSQFLSVSAFDEGNTEAALIEHEEYLCMVLEEQMKSKIGWTI